METISHRVFLCIGGNIDNRQHYLQSTLELITNRIGTIVALSDVYESEAWGFEHTTPFLNQVVAVDTELSPLNLLAACQSIETQLGRVRNPLSDTYTARTVDVDILFYDDIVCNYPNLTIPHPFIQKRRFVLEPLAQIAPKLNHPVLNKSVQSLKEECDDKTKVWRYVLPNSSVDE